MYYFFAQYINCLSSNGHNHIHFATTDCCDAFLDCLSIHLNYCLTLCYINPRVPTEQKSCFLKYVWLKLFVEHFVLFLNYLFSVCVKMWKQKCTWTINHGGYFQIISIIRPWFKCWFLQVIGGLDLVKRCWVFIASHSKVVMYSEFFFSFLFSPHVTCKSQKGHYFTVNASIVPIFKSSWYVKDFPSFFFSILIYHSLV